MVLALHERVAAPVGVRAVDVVRVGQCVDVVAEVAVADGQRGGVAGVVDAGATEQVDAGVVAGDGAIADRQRAGVVDAAAVLGEVAAEVAAADRCRAGVVDAAPVVQARLPLRRCC